MKMLRLIGRTVQIGWETGDDNTTGPAAHMAYHLLFTLSGFFFSGTCSGCSGPIQRNCIACSFS